MRWLIWTGLSLQAVIPSALAQQWTATVLHPPGLQESQVTAINATHQGGYGSGPASGGAIQAGIWAGSAESWLPLSAAGDFAAVRGMDERRQVGGYSAPPHGASMWQGTAQSWTPMHPQGYARSSLTAVRGGMYVGNVRQSTTGPDHAALWIGGPENLVDLHPAGADWSTAAATDGVLQGGAVHWSATNITSPAIWKGTPESIVNLRPGAGGYVHGMARGVQVGSTSHPRAALWRGTPESFVDMRPPGVNLSTLKATTGRIHAGAYAQSGASRAGVNFGMPTSWVSLHQFLPPGYSFSEATCIYQAGDTIYVGGWAINAATSYHNAILWTGTLPCYANCDESTTPPVLNVSDFVCFLQRFAEGDGYANCDKSTTAPILNVADFACFLQRFAQGCP